MSGRSSCAILVSVLAVALAGMAFAVPAPVSRAARAQRLYEDALRRLERRTTNQKRLALEELEQAALLDPDHPLYAVAAGRVCLSADLLHQARHWAESVIERDSLNDDGEYLLGSAWRREWIITMDERSLDRAIEHVTRGARLAGNRCDRWVTLVPLLLERDEMAGAVVAAQLAMDSDSANADALLAGAYVAYRSGEVERAGALFARALPRLPAEVRERFEAIQPLVEPVTAAAIGQMSPSQRRDFVADFWKDSDPDLVTPENEAQLEYWSRAAHAYFLYYVPRRGWDLRGDLLVRFGPPAWADRNPMFLEPTIDTTRGTWLLWGYPQLGMRIWMQATNPLGTFDHPFVDGYRPPVAYPDSIARHPELMALGSGAAVFSRIPPATRLLDLRCALARFEGEHDRRLMAHAETPGGPTDTLWLEWAVYDSSRQQVRHDAHPMSVSACAPTEARSGSFFADLPPGGYRVGVSVRGNGSRGVFAGFADLRRPVGGLTLSDVVVTCGVPQTGFTSGQGVRLEPNPGARVARSDQLTAYFEIYHLAPEANGSSRFEYVYTVRSIQKDPRMWIQRALAPRRLPPPIVASRSEETGGPVRRQFVTVPIRGLPDGEYELEIRVHDLVSGAETSAAAPFTRGD